MSLQSIPDPVAEKIIRAVRTIIQKRPVLEPIIRSFAEIAMEQHRLGRQWAEGPSIADGLRQNLDPERLSQGVPLLAGVAFDPLQTALEQSVDAMLAVMQRVFSQPAADFAAIEEFKQSGRLDSGKAARAYLAGDAAALSALAEAGGVAPSVLALLAHTSLSAVLRQLEPELAVYTEPLQWLRGYCPICGSMPSISYLAEAGDLGSEFLKGGGGQRFLHCSLCGHQWRFLRSKCPACETEASDMHLYFQTEQDNSERIDVCRSCKGYLPCIDLRETTERLPLDIAAVGMLHLDAWAAENGYHPLAPGPWNLLR